MHITQSKRQKKTPDWNIFQTHVCFFRLVDEIGCGSSVNPGTDVQDLVLRNTTTDVEELYKFVYPHYQDGIMSSKNSAILSLRNVIVDQHNEHLSSFLPGMEHVLYSADSLDVSEEAAGTQSPLAN